MQETTPSVAEDQLHLPCDRCLDLGPLANEVKGGVLKHVLPGYGWLSTVFDVGFMDFAGSGASGARLGRAPKSQAWCT